jgi:hypothetical protein
MSGWGSWCVTGSARWRCDRHKAASRHRIGKMKLKVTNWPEKLASYRSPVGRLAALAIGSDQTLLRGAQAISVEVQEFARFQPRLLEGAWDARNSVVAGDKYVPLSIDLFRKLLERAEPGVHASLLETMLDEESDAEAPNWLSPERDWQIQPIVPAKFCMSYQMQ